MIFNYQKNITYIKITRIGVVGGEMWQIGTGKLGSRRRQLDMGPAAGTFQAQLFSAARSLDYFWVLSLESARYGAHTQFTFQKYPHLGPPSTTSDIRYQKSSTTCQKEVKRFQLYKFVAVLEPEKHISLCPCPRTLIIRCLINVGRVS